MVVKNITVIKVIHIIYIVRHRGYLLHEKKALRFLIQVLSFLFILINIQHFIICSLHYFNIDFFYRFLLKKKKNAAKILLSNLSVIEVKYCFFHDYLLNKKTILLFIFCLFFNQFLIIIKLFVLFMIINRNAVNQIASN